MALVRYSSKSDGIKASSVAAAVKDEAIDIIDKIAKEVRNNSIELSNDSDDRDN